LTAITEGLRWLWLVLVKYLICDNVGVAAVVVRSRHVGVFLLRATS